MSLYTQNIDHCFNAGVTRGEVEALAASLSPSELASRPDSGPLIALPGRTDDLPAIEALAGEWRGRFRHVVVAGAGGSGLSGRTLTALARAPEFHYLENIDPDPLENMLAWLDVRETCFLIISKSGGTVETLSQYYVLTDHVGRLLGEAGMRERFAVITMSGQSPLRLAAESAGIRILDHPPGIGGRYAALTAVGLLPAALAGLDIRALRRGAQSVVSALADPGCAPALGAALQVAHMRKNFPLSVMLAYGERLAPFTLWYRQNWAESLGKQGKGSTPVAAIGVTDQHSQLQLWLDGPKDKLFTLITLDRAGTGPRIPVPGGAGLPYLEGKTLGDVMAAQQRATLETLAQNHCPVRHFALETLTEETMGALLMHFMIEIILSAQLLGVNPFDQPAIEAGKALARQYLS